MLCVISGPSEFDAIGLLKILFSALLLQIYVKQDWKSVLQFGLHTFSACFLCHFDLDINFCRYKSVVAELCDTHCHVVQS
jgi:hypothetical protein